MSAIRVRKKVESETLHLPELKPFIDKDVEIVVREDPAAVKPSDADWDAALQAAKELRETGYDFDAVRHQREYDLKHANDHLP